MQKQIRTIALAAALAMPMAVATLGVMVPTPAQAGLVLAEGAPPMSPWERFVALFIPRGRG